MILSSYAKDTYLAPYMSRFTSADIPDMSQFADESARWLETFALLTMFGLNLPTQTRQAMFNFLRRAEAAYRAYEDARIETTQFVSDGGALITYARAMSYWETFLSQAWQGYALVGQLFGQRAFEKADGSVAQRLHALYNQTKHVESMIADGRMPENGTMSVWLTNGGLQGHAEALSYDETSEIVRNIVLWARQFRDPAAMVKAIRDGEDLP